MDPSSRYLCVISEDQRKEYEAEFAQMKQLGIDFIFENSPEMALPMIGELNPNLIFLGTEIENYEGIEFLTMIMNQYKDFYKPIVVLPEKEDGLPPMLHSRSQSTGKSLVEAVSFEQITALVTQASQESPAASPTASPAPSEALLETEFAAAFVDVEAPQAAAQAPSPTRSSKAILISLAIGAAVVLVVGGILFALFGGTEEKHKTEDNTALQATSPTEEPPNEAEKDHIEEKKEPDIAATPSQESLSGDPLPSSKEFVLPIVFYRRKSIPKITDSKMMDSIVESLKQQPTALIVLTGHASSEGEAVDNFSLAMNRAKNVMELLVKRGISANRFELKSLGSNVPATSNETEEGRAKNRRVSIQIIP